MRHMLRPLPDGKTRRDGRSDSDTLHITRRQDSTATMQTHCETTRLQGIDVPLHAMGFTGSKLFLAPLSFAPEPLPIRLNMYGCGIIESFG